MILANQSIMVSHWINFRKGSRKGGIICTRYIFSTRRFRNNQNYRISSERTGQEDDRLGWHLRVLILASILGPCV
uniref:Uncharacterized protein n=1 Tax=Haemonchus contortus TaxID=6289 RepID=A0A7I4YHJ5_HAECO